MVYRLCCTNCDCISPTSGVNAGMNISATSIALSTFAPFLGTSEGSPVTTTNSPNAVKNNLSSLAR